MNMNLNESQSVCRSRIITTKLIINTQALAYRAVKKHAHTQADRDRDRDRDRETNK